MARAMTEVPVHPAPSLETIAIASIASRGKRARLLGVFPVIRKKESVT
jgi:hypothetical protein